MSFQLLELLFFGSVAFFVISKLIATFGSTDVNSNKSNFFGENPSNLKDVTNTVSNKNVFSKKTALLLKNCIVNEKTDQIIYELNKLITEKLHNFDPILYITNVKQAFYMIVSSYGKDSILNNLIDPKYLLHFHKFFSFYAKEKDIKNLSAKFNDICVLGNSVFIQILFSWEVIPDKTIIMQEWTFTKNLVINNPNWYVTNIDNHRL